MAKRRVRLEVWMIYDSETGYVWPQVYAKKPPHLSGENARYNHPLKALRLRSGVYKSDERHRSSSSFGTEVSEKEKKVE